MKFIQGFLTALIVLAISAVAVAYSGVVNVAAGAPEPGILQWFLSTTMKHSVKSHAREVTASVEPTDQRAREGFRIYRAACVYCHGAPKQDPGDIGKGLNPKPPYLGDTVGGWTNAELFWIVKHGIKMSAMPAWGRSLDDGALWDLVAFLEQLPRLTPEAYQQLSR